MYFVDVNMSFHRFSFQMMHRWMHTRTKLTQKMPEAIKWWDSYYSLSYLNTARVPFIVNGIMASGIKNQIIEKPPLYGIKILEVGCGGGILCEDLAKLGADIVGLDIDPQVIQAAKEHQALDESIKDNLKYINTSIEEHEKYNREKYDAVVISEVIEHIPNEQKGEFLTNAISTLQYGGLLFMTCPSKTIISRFFVIFLAELLNLIPKGTHDYKEFISTENLVKMIENRKCEIKTVEGILFNPFKVNFTISQNRSLFYAIHAVKMR